MKLDWALQQIAELEEEIREFFSDDNYEIVPTFNEHRVSKGFTLWDGFVQPDLIGMWEITLRITKEAPTERWSLLVGDIINNLRSSLDHSVFALAITGSGQEVPPRSSGLKFLICQEKSDFDGKSLNSLLSVPRPAYDFIESVQPFHNTNSVLTTLQKLSNADKHHGVHLAVTFLREFSIFDAKTVGHASVKTTFGYTHDSGEKVVTTLVDGLELTTSIFGTPEVNLAADVQTDAEFEVIFDEDPIASYKVVIELLREIAVEISRILENLKSFI